MRRIQLKTFDYIAILLSAGIFAAFFVAGQSLSLNNGYVQIQSLEGEFIYDLGENRIIDFHGPVGTSTIEIIDGKAHFLHSDCEDDLCVRMGFVENAADWAACLPNQVFISVTGSLE